MRFALIHAEKAQFPIVALCRALGVSRRGYYAWAQQPEGARAAAHRELCREVLHIHKSSRATYGSPRIHAALRANGTRISKTRVERAMSEQGLSGRRRRSFRNTTVRDNSHNVEPNTLARDFTAARPNKRWVTDITYIRTAGGFSYLAAIIDLFSRKVVGWALGTDLSTELALRALRNAFAHRRPPLGLLHHSDRGSQYTSEAYRSALRDSGVEVSMSRKGNCWDNAVAESFFSTLKSELVINRRWKSHGELEQAIFEYIEVFYNRQRIHSSLAFRTPAQVEETFNAAKAA